MTHREVAKFLILHSIGNFLVLFALFGVGATFGPVLYYEAQFQVDQARGVKYTVESTVPKTSAKEPQPSGLAAVINKPKNQVLVPQDPNFSLIIPKIGASSKVFPNVDPNNPDEFLPILQKGVAHAKGTVFPGMNGNIYLFAHSTDNFWDVGRYNAVFYLLKDMIKGDEVDVFFEGVRHIYTVSDTKIVPPDEVSYITNAQQNLNNPVQSETLILQTCWPPGTTFDRFLVFAKPKGK